MKCLCVRDVMTGHVQTLDASTSVDEAARLLTDHHISGTPVLSGGRIVGVLSKSDLLDPENRPEQGKTLTVDAVMMPIVYAVRAGDPVMLAVRLMVEEGIHRVVVVDEAGALQGIVTPMDILRALARGADVRAEDERLERRGELHGNPAVAVGEYVDLRTLKLEG